MPRRCTNGGIQSGKGAQRGNILKQFTEGFFGVLQGEQPNQQIFMHLHTQTRPHLTPSGLGWRTRFLK